MDEAAEFAFRVLDAHGRELRKGHERVSARAADTEKQLFIHAFALQVSSSGAFSLMVRLPATVRGLGDASLVLTYGGADVCVLRFRVDGANPWWP